MKKFTTSVFAAGALLVLGAGVLPCAHGQVAVSIGEGVGESGVVTSSGLSAYVKILGLDAAQQEAARELLEGTTAATRTATDEMRAEMKGFQDKLREAVQKDGVQALQEMMGEEMQPILKKYTQRRSELESQFFEDFKLLLTDAQREKFPAVERHRRRETGLRGPNLGVDLVAVAEETGVRAASGEAAEALERYETELDRLLVERSRLTKESRESQEDAMKRMDLEAIENSQKHVKDNGLAIRELTKVSVAKIASFLSEEKRAAFEMGVKRREFPRVYSAPHISKAVEAALAMSDLDAIQRQSLRELKDRYERDAGPLNQKWAQAIEADRDTGNVRMAIQDAVNGMRLDPDKGANQCQKARKELDEATEKRLLELLTPDQRTRLPAKRPEKGGQGFMGMDDGEGQGISISVTATSDEHGPVEEVEEKKKEDR
jgi:hypothetical protein